jgi:hypothetical protein
VKPTGHLISRASNLDEHVLLWSVVKFIDPWVELGNNAFQQEGHDYQQQWDYLKHIFSYYL